MIALSNDTLDVLLEIEIWCLCHFWTWYQNKRVHLDNYIQVLICSTGEWSLFCYSQRMFQEFFGIIFIILWYGFPKGDIIFFVAADSRAGLQQLVVSQLTQHRGHFINNPKCINCIQIWYSVLKLVSFMIPKLDISHT